MNNRAAPGDTPPGDGLDELRALLLGDQRQQLAHLTHRIGDPSQRANDVGQVLAQSVAVSSANGPGLSAALVPNVEDAISESIRRNPQTLADALFPVMGPAIRKSIAAALQSLTQSIEQTIDHSFSPKGLRWRIEALRTGRPFGEVVLRHTLLYRVEQVFLIDRRTGLLMQHAAADHVQVEDTDMVSSMFSAIQDFVRDSFHATDKETLDSLQVGERLVWIEQGPLASLAGVIRGNPPQELRDTFRQTIEQIHQVHRDALQSFEGDSVSLSGTRGQLESCLQARFGGQRGKQEGTARDGTSNKKRLSPVLVGLALVAVAFTGWALWTWWQSQRWQGFVERLSAEPGIVITQSGRIDGKYRVAGLRDGLAVDPQTVLRNTGLDPKDVHFDWEPYVSLRPQFVRQRAIDRLKPPASVQIQLDGQTLVAQGSAPIAWLQQAQRDATALPGVVAFDASKVMLAEDPVWLALRDRIQATGLGTVEGSSRLEAGQDQTLSQLIADLHQLGAIAHGRGARAQVDILGRADGRGSVETNLLLSDARARTVAAALSVQPLPHVDLRTIAVGDAEPLRPELSPEDRAHNRGVRFRVHPLPPAKTS